MSDIIPTYSLQTFTVEDFDLEAPYIKPSNIERYVRVADVEVSTATGELASVRLTQTAETVLISFPNASISLEQVYELVQEALALEARKQNRKYPLASITEFGGEN